MKMTSEIGRRKSPKSDKSSNFKFFDRSKTFGATLDVSRIFGLDYDTDVALKNFITAKQDLALNSGLADADTPPFKFVYLVENEKITSTKMFFVEQRRVDFVEKLKGIKSHFENFIQRKYKNCITKIGFSSEKELYNILNKMLASSDNFFNQPNVRRILGQFWLSIREVLDTIKIKKMHNSLLKPTAKVTTTSSASRHSYYLSALDSEINHLSKQEE